MPHRRSGYWGSVPPTGPRPDDIAFDQAAAAAAVAALDRARAVIDDVGASRVSAGATAREDFRGAYARDFTESDRRLGRACDDAASQVDELRSAIAEAMEAARRAQAARVIEQRAWDAADAPPIPAGVA